MQPGTIHRDMMVLVREDRSRLFVAMAGLVLVRGVDPVTTRLVVGMIPGMEG